MPALEGCAEPRLATKPLRPLTPKTSLGFECIRFCDEFIAEPLLPWQRTWLIRALEVDAAGNFRYRTVLTLVARQSGKTHLLKCLTLWLMMTGRVRMVLGVAQKVEIAKEAWDGVIEMARADPELAAEIAGTSNMAGAITLKLHNGSRYRITAANGRAGRGLSVDLLLLDELAQHRDWKAWSALSKTTIARPNALIVGISNAGDDQAVVMNAIRANALTESDPTLGLFEWSAPEGCELDDRAAWAQANPGLGHTVTERALAAALATDPPNVFRTEVLCQRVDQLDGAIDLGAWGSCADAKGTMDDAKRDDRVVMCIDVAPDGKHVSLVAASTMSDGRVRVEVVAGWSDTKTARAELQPILDRVKPRALGWFPGGPAAALAADLKGIRKAKPIKATDVSAVCMGFSEQITARRVVHSNDALLNAQVSQVAKLPTGDGWRFNRKDTIGHCDAVYAAAGAVHLARTLPPPPKPRRLLTAA